VYLKIVILVLSLIAVGCYFQTYPVTPSIEDDSTFSVWLPVGQGTAWVVAPGWLMTAGHVCIAQTDGNQVILRSSAGRILVGHWLEAELSDGPGADACLIHTEAELPPPLVLMRHAPAKGTHDFIVGYPRGAHARTFGEYLGGDESSSPIQPGSSGSAVATAEGVYMMATHIHNDGTTAGTPVTELIRFLDNAGVVGYTLTPDSPFDDA